MRIALILVLLATPALSQTPAGGTTPPSAAPTAPTQQPSGNVPTSTPQQPAASTTQPAPVAPETPVITLRGFCPSAPAGTDQKSADCKTVVTRAEFEKLVNTLSPNMPGAVRQRLAQDYSQMLVLSDQAAKKGLDKTQKFEDILKFMRMRVLAQEYVTSVQENSKPTPADVEKYYQDNKSKYQELTANRLFIPRNRPAPASEKAPEPKPLTDDQLKPRAEKFRARLAAGEGFEKLQKEAYEAAGFKTPPPPTVTTKRLEGSSPDELELFSLKKGDLSKVIVDPAGATIYQVQETKLVPLEEVKPGIEGQLASERMRQQLDSLSTIAKPELNQAYFSSLKAEEPVRGMMPPGGAPSASQSTPGGAPRAAVPKPAASKSTSTTPKATPKK
jgi:PPIC-type PPIASE domain